MALRLRSILFWLSILLQTALAQFGPDARWNVPDGTQVDFTSTFVAGSTTVLSWKPLNSSVSDLWLTHWEQAKFPWHYQVATNVDISSAGTLSWYINVPASTISSDNRFVLRFFPRNAPFAVLQIPQNASPGFYLTGGAAASLTSSPTGTSETGQVMRTTGIISNLSPSSISQTTASQGFATSILTTTNAVGSTIIATITTAIPSITSTTGSTQTAVSSQPGSTLSLAGQVGVGVGAGVSVILLFIAGCFFGRRLGQKRVSRSYENELGKESFLMNKSSGYNNITGTGTGGKNLFFGPYTSDLLEDAALIPNRNNGEHPARLYQHGTPMVELDGGMNQLAEKDGSTRHAIEKSSVMVRPGVHEAG